MSEEPSSCEGKVSSSRRAAVSRWTLLVLAVALGVVVAPAASLRDAALTVLLVGALSERLPARPEAGWQPFANLDAHRNAAVAELVEHVSANSRPEDRIFVWGWLASLYTLTDRLPASRFLYCTFLTGLIPWTNLADPNRLDHAVPGSWTMLRADLRRHPPLYIIDATPGNDASFGRYPATSVPELARLLEEEYTRERVVRLPDGSDYFHLYRRRDDPRD